MLKKKCLNSILYLFDKNVKYMLYNSNFLVEVFSVLDVLFLSYTMNKWMRFQTKPNIYILYALYKIVKKNQKRFPNYKVK